MKDSRKTKAYLIAELEEMRGRLEKLECENWQMRQSLSQGQHYSPYHPAAPMAMLASPAQLRAAEPAQTPQLHDQFQSKIRKLSDASIALTSTHSFESLCREVVRLGRDILGFDRLALWLLDDDGRFMMGTFGTDESGNLRDEKSIRRLINGQIREIFRGLCAGRSATSTRPCAQRWGEHLLAVAV